MSRTRPRPTQTEPQLDDPSRVFPRAELKPRPTIESVERLETRPPEAAPEAVYPQRVSVTRAPALTEREEKVRRILLKELGGLNLNTIGADGLSYVERQKLLKTLDVGYLESEIASLRSRLRTLDWLPWVTSVGAGIYSAVNVASLGPVYGIGLMVLVTAAAFGWGVSARKAVRRRLYIFEALHALSDADETDVVLSRAVEDADRLISEVTRRALAAERRSGHG
jgi:hypothetical protein